MEWLEKNGFLDCVSLASVSFKVTRSEKVARICELGCSHFIDDLPEVLADSGMPADLTRILFDPEAAAPKSDTGQVVNSWAQLKTLFGL
jgi:hypothetical protein